jgi:lipopolysaccharide export system permease protein
MMPLQCLEALPIAVLMAVLFVLGSLQRSNEIVAMSSGGIPPERCFKIFFATGLGLSLLGLVAHETFIPKATHYSELVYHTRITHFGEWKQVNFDNKVVSGLEGRFWYFDRLSTDSGQVNGPVVDSYDNGELKSQVSAVTASKTPEGWLFQKGAVRDYDEHGARLASNRIFDQQVFPYPETPDGLVPIEVHPEELNSLELRSWIHRMKSLGLPTRGLEVELYAKLALPLASFVVMCLGIPLALVRRTSRVRAVVYTLALSFFYLGLVQFGKALAQNLVSPLAGAWLANGACLMLSGVLWFRRRAMV